MHTASEGAVLVLSISLSLGIDVSGSASSCCCSSSFTSTACHTLIFPLPLPGQCTSTCSSSCPNHRFPRNLRHLPIPPRRVVVHKLHYYCLFGIHCSWIICSLCDRCCFRSRSLTLTGIVLFFLYCCCYFSLTDTAQP